VILLHSFSGDVLTYSCMMGYPRISIEACWETGAPVTYTAVDVKYVECSGSNKTEIVCTVSLNYIKQVCAFQDGED
jgi:hypothetical protein